MGRRKEIHHQDGHLTKEEANTSHRCKQRKAKLTTTYASKKNKGTATGTDFANSEPNQTSETSVASTFEDSIAQERKIITSLDIVKDRKFMNDLADRNVGELARSKGNAEAGKIETKEGWNPQTTLRITSCRRTKYRNS